MDNKEAFPNILCIGKLNQAILFFYSHTREHTLYIFGIKRIYKVPLHILESKNESWLHKAIYLLLYFISLFVAGYK